VAAAAVVADGGRRLALVGEQTVRERRLPGARRTDDGGSPVALEERGDVRNSFARHGADRVRPDEAGRSHVRRGRGPVVRQVGLRENDDRLGAALPGGREVALEPPPVRAAVERIDDEDDVHVRSEHLLAAATPGRLSDEGGPALEHGANRGPAAVEIDHDPVPDGGEVGLADGVAVQPARRLGANLARGDEHAVAPPLLVGDAAGHEALMRGELALSRLVPAEACEIEAFRVFEVQAKLLDRV